MDRYFNPEIETASREYLWALQSARLIKMVHNAYDHVPFYQKKFDEIGLLPVSYTHLTLPTILRV